MNSRRLLHFVGTSRVGGAEQLLSSLASGLRDDGWTTGIVVLDAPGPLAEVNERAADRIWHLDLARPGVLGALRDWRSILRTLAPDGAVLQGARANLLGRLTTGAVPVVKALRSVYIDERGTQVGRWLARATLHRVDACIANSQAAVQRHVAAGFPDPRH